MCTFPKPLFCTLVPRVRVESVQSLVKMGFPLEGSRRAVYFSGNKGVEAAVTWITQHQNDPGRQPHVQDREPLYYVLCIMC